MSSLAPDDVHYNKSDQQQLCRQWHLTMVIGYWWCCIFNNKIICIHTINVTKTTHSNLSLPVTMKVHIVLEFWHISLYIFEGTWLVLWPQHVSWTALCHAALPCLAGDTAALTSIGDTFMDNWTLPRGFPPWELRLYHSCVLVIPCSESSATSAHIHTDRRTDRQTTANTRTQSHILCKYLERDVDFA